MTCLPFGRAQTLIQDAGLNPVVSQDSVAINTQCPHGNKVAQQDPPSGTAVDPGTDVTLFPGFEPEPTGPTGETGDG